jgi:ribosomal 50S subunit-recycling heat shock protein
MKIKTKNLKKGDKIRVEFGDYENWVDVEMLADSKRTDEGSWELYVKYLNSNSKTLYMYSISAEEEHEVIE